MRIYYIFLIKDEVYKLSKDKPNNLYKLLESIYLLNNDDIVYAFKMFDKLCKTINKRNINKIIKDNNSDKLTYTNFNNTHMINDFYLNETSKIIINNSHIKLKTNSPYSTFFKDLQNIPNLFICDFINNDYFFLKNKIFSR